MSKGDNAVLDAPHAAEATAPAKFGVAGVYTEQDKDKAQAIGSWLSRHQQSRAWLATKARIASSTISQLLNGKYPSSPTDMLNTMLAILQVEAERIGDGTPGYVEGAVHKLISVVCDRTRKHGSFGVVCGHVGVGKTRSLKEYAKRKPQTVVIETNPAMTPGTLLAELLEALDVAAPAGLDAKFRAVVKVLAGTTYLLIVDEAENCNATALHYLRRIRDKAGVGVVLAGTERLHALIRPEHGQFDQIRSRVAMWPATIKAINRDDADDMARAGLPEFGEISDAALAELWSFCAGSARVLMEDLVPALRDYGKGHRELTPGLVQQVAEKVLFMTKRAAAS